MTQTIFRSKHNLNQIPYSSHRETKCHGPCLNMSTTTIHHSLVKFSTKNRSVLNPVDQNKDAKGPEKQSLDAATMARRKQNAQLPISALPPELLLDIFQGMVYDCWRDVIQANIFGETPTQWAELFNVYSYWRAVIQAEPRLQAQIETCDSAFSDVSLRCPGPTLSSIFTSPPGPYPSQSSRIQVYTSSSRELKSSWLVMEYANYQFTSSHREGVDSPQLVLEAPILDANRSGSETVSPLLRPIWLGFAFPAGITDLCIRSPSTGPITPLLRLQDLLDILEWLPSLRHLVIVDIQPIPHPEEPRIVRRRLKLPRLRSISMEGTTHQCAFLATRLSLSCISFVNFRMHRNSLAPSPPKDAFQQYGWLDRLMFWMFKVSFRPSKTVTFRSPIVAIQYECKRIADQFELEVSGWDVVVARLNEITSNEDRPLPNYRLTFPLGGRFSPSLLNAVCIYAGIHLMTLEELTLCGSYLSFSKEIQRLRIFGKMTVLKRIRTIGHPASLLPSYLSQVMDDSKKVHPMLREIVIVPTAEECPGRDGCCIRTRTYWNSLARCLSERKQAGSMVQILELRGPSCLKTEIDDPGIMKALKSAVGEFRCVWY